MTYLPERIGDGAFVFSVDHCFSIRGQGTILTGTILQGAVGINDVRNDLLDHTRKFLTTEFTAKYIINTANKFYL